MDPIRNPFTPGAGSRPPVLAGRDAILEGAGVALSRVILRRPAQSQMLLGLRGVGKTVLLNCIDEMAQDAGYICSRVDARDDGGLAPLLYPWLHQVLRQLSLIESSKPKAVAALRGLKGFASAHRVDAGDASVAYDTAPGVADSGAIEADLVELFVLVGEAASAASKGWALLIDEAQCLRSADFSALIAAIHRVGQKNLPVLFFGAGLPHLAEMAADAKAYADRLFTYVPVGPLDLAAATHAITQPIHDGGATIEPAALAAIIAQSQYHPYFLQEWGFQVWNAAQGSAIAAADLLLAHHFVLRRLDEGFFKPRVERLAPKERGYVGAMAVLGGDGPYRTTDVARSLGESAQALGPIRARLISKGMVYSPAHGDLAFTVPMFADFLRRNRFSSRLL